MSTAGPFTSATPAATCCAYYQYTNFEDALGLTTGSKPPDTQVAVGTNYVVEMVNDRMVITDKTGTFVKSNDLAPFFQAGPTTVPGSTTPVNLPNISDLKVVYNRFTQRFYAAEMVYDKSTNNTSIKLAVSYTADPTGNWQIYLAQYEAGVLLDQPKIGISRDKIIIDWNKYTGFEPNQTYQGDETLVIPSSEAEAYVGGVTPLDTYLINVGQNYTLPVINTDTDLSGPLDAYEVYFHTDLFGGSLITVRTITGVPANGPGVSTSTSGDVGIGNLTNPPAAAQLGSTTTLKTGYDIGNSASFRAGTLWVAANDGCQPNGQPVLSCARIIKFASANSGSPTRAMDTDLYAKNSALMYPAITLDDNNDTFITYSMSSASIYPEVEMLAAPSGTLSFTGGLVRQGFGPIPADDVTHNTARFGDYSGIAVDGSNPTRVWVAGEFGPSAPNTPDNPTSNTYAWGTAVAEFSF